MEDKNVSWTMKKLSAPTSSPPSCLQQELYDRLVANSNDTNNILDFIKSKVPAAYQSSPEFIRDLTYALAKSCSSSSGTDVSCNRSKLEQVAGNILRKFTCTSASLEVHVMFALQKLATDCDHPKTF